MNGLRALAIAVAFGFCAAGQTPAPDTILVNGHVVTVDTSFSIAQAVAIRGDRFVAVGSNADIGRLAGPNTGVDTMAPPNQASRRDVGVGVASSGVAGAGSPGGRAAPLERIWSSATTIGSSGWAKLLTVCAPSAASTWKLAASWTERPRTSTSAAIVLVGEVLTSFK